MTQVKRQPWKLEKAERENHPQEGTQSESRVCLTNRILWGKGIQVWPILLFHSWAVADPGLSENAGFSKHSPTHSMPTHHSQEVPRYSRKPVHQWQSWR